MKKNIFFYFLTLACIKSSIAQTVNAYVTNYNESSVSVINTASNTVTATVSVGNGPTGVAVNPGGTRVYIGNYYGNSVSVINTGNNTVIATIAPVSTPTGVAVSPDGNTVYVANQGASSISVISAATNTVVATITVGNTPQGVVVSPDGTKAYVANYNSDNVSVINTATNTVITTIPVGDGPEAVAVTPDGTKAFVPNYNSNNLSVINTATNTVIATTSVGNGAWGVAVSPNGTRAYVAASSGGVSVVNTATNAVIATITVGGGVWGVAVSPDGSKVYAAKPYSSDNTVAVINTATNTVFTTIVAGNTPTAFGNFIGTVPSALPVTWISTYASLNNLQQAVINWKVQEQNVFSYEIQKSNDGNSFINIGTLNSKGDGENSYEFTDMLSLRGDSYYRIKQTDISGRVAYSIIIKLSNANYGLPIAIYPNPSKDVIKISVGDNLLHTHALLIDVSGRTIQKISIDNLIQTVNISALAKGMYLIRFANGSISNFVKD